MFCKTIHHADGLVCNGIGSTAESDSDSTGTAIHMQQFGQTERWLERTR